MILYFELRMAQHARLWLPPPPMPHSSCHTYIPQLSLSLVSGIWSYSSYNHNKIGILPNMPDQMQGRLNCGQETGWPEPSPSPWYSPSSRFQPVLPALRRSTAQRHLSSKGPRHAPVPKASLNWVAAKELKLSYHTSGSLVYYYIYICIYLQNGLT